MAVRICLCRIGLFCLVINVYDYFFFNSFEILNIF